MALAFLTVAWAAWPASGDEPSSDSPKKETRRECGRIRIGNLPLDLLRPNWGLLDFYQINSSDPDAPPSRRIKSIKVTLTEKKATPWGDSLVGDKRVEYETNDPHVLEVIEEFLRHPLRLAVGKYGDKSCECGYVVGKVVVTTATEDFAISITRREFLLGDRVPAISRVFYSWGLAHFLDDLYFKQTGNRISADVLNSLSGEGRMEKDRKAFQKGLSSSGEP